MIYGAMAPVAVKLPRMGTKKDLIGTSQEARAERVRLLQRAFGMTRTEFAAAIGVSPQTVYNWEKTQNVSSEGALAILRVFGVSTDWTLAGLEKGLDDGPAEKIRAARRAPH